MKKVLTKSDVDRAESILAAHKYSLPLPEAEMFCKLYLGNIVCNVDITYKLFKPFIDFREDVVYKFTPPPKLDDKSHSYYNVVLEQITINNLQRKSDQDKVAFSQFLASHYNSNIEWGADALSCSITL
jgi:hypothetical protein